MQSLELQSRHFDTVKVILRQQGPNFTVDVRSFAQPSPEFGEAEMIRALDDGHQKAIKLLEQYMQRLELVESLGTYPTGQKLSEVYWRSLIQDNDGTIPSSYGRYLEEIRTNISDLDPESAFITSMFDMKKMINNKYGTVKLFGMNMRTLFGIGFALICAWNRAKSPTFFPSLRTSCIWMAICASSTCIVDVLSRLSFFQFRIFKARQLLQHKRRLLTRSVDFSLVEDQMDFNISRSLCLTQKGCVAWIPESGDVNDEICQFHGCRLPFLTRQTTRDAQHGEEYTLVGDCYLHGLMAEGATDVLGGSTKRIRIV
jgi:hypothetical protein